ncbi:MAG: mannose-1-phosphate guanylyltransferase [Prevotella sp.]|jgi:mannose-1-phosphate guanylyltransferase
MTSTNNYYCVILAGGKGTRLWPCSRKEKPKQFLDFFGTGRTQLQSTYDRMVKILSPDHIIVNTHVDYADLVREQLPELPSDNLLVEPIHRSTAPSIAWACHRLSKLHPNACFIATPSDQTIINDEEFRRSVMEGFSFVSTHNSFLSIGIRPTRPEPGYGYIQVGESLGNQVYNVKSFTEKPEREFAKMFLESGEFFWNTGLILGSVKTMHDYFDTILPPVLRDFSAKHPSATPEEESAYMMEHFSLYPNLSADTAILERSDNVCVMTGNFGWADLGTWHGIYEAMQKGDDDNVVVDSDVMLENCHNNVIKLPHGKMGVFNGLDGFIVAEKDNVLFICRKEDSSALVRKYVNEVQLRKGDDFV